jgi:hypothetical protein
MSHRDVVVFHTGTQQLLHRLEHRYLPASFVYRSSVIG